MDNRELYIMAREAMEHAYAPYSKFKVGAALLTADGRVFTGVNVENASFGATICAERTACVKAVSEGYKEFDAIAVASSRGGAPMCGICRQFLSEFAPDLTVITGDDEDHLNVMKLTQLLPDNFRL
jgi:cytidine deaminase